MTQKTIQNWTNEEATLADAQRWEALDEPSQRSIVRFLWAEFFEAEVANAHAQGYEEGFDDGEATSEAG